MKLFGMRIAKDNVARREAMEIYRTAFSHGAEHERDIIIALLETEATIYPCGLLDPEEVIALIKGETEYLSP